MSNAMRSSKSILAGLAAGALGAGVLAFAAAPAAQAGVGATVAFDYPSATIVATASDFGAVPVPISVYDSSGDAADSMTGVAVQVTVAAPTTADFDDTVGVSLNGGTTSINQSSASTADLALATIRPVSAPTAWPAVLTQDGAGTYTITAKLISTGSGSVLSTATMPVQVVANTAAPAATVAFINGSGNVIGNIGVSADDSVATVGLAVVNATGGPYWIRDDSVTLSSNSSTLGFGASATQSRGAAPGTYVFDPNGAGDTTGAAGTKTATGVVTPVSPSLAVGSGTVTFNVGDVVASAPMTVNLTTTPAFYVVDDTWQVPPGTSKLAFSIALEQGATSGTLPWNATSNATGGRLTAAGGASSVVVDQTSVELNVNAAASAAGSVVRFTAGASGPYTKTVNVVFATPAATVETAAPIAKLADPAALPGTITDQYGNALPGTWAIRVLNGASVSCSASVTPIATTTADASGKFLATVPAANSPSTPGAATFTVCASNGFTSANANASITYTQSGGVTSLTAAGTISTGTATSLPVVQVPGTGVANLSTLTSQQQTATTTLTPAVISAAGTAFQITATVSPAANVVFTGTDGVRFSTAVAGSVLFSQGAATETVLASGTPATSTVSVYAIKPGVHTVTVTAGTTSTTYSFKAGVARGSIRTIEADPASLRIAPNEFKAISVKATDIYGNAVPDDTSITVALAGGGTLSAGTGTTSAAGVMTVYYTAPVGTGNGKAVWTAGTYVSGVIPGVADAKAEASTDITVTTGADKTILIVGERTTVSGKPGIKVEGDTTGFDAGAKMKPWVRFPGETEYNAGSARPTVSVAGDFTWQRKTGKKTYVFFSSEDDAIKSNRVIIAAN